jgi:hypothetical protein
MYAEDCLGLNHKSVAFLDTPSCDTILLIYFLNLEIETKRTGYPTVWQYRNATAKKKKLESSE